ncbi:MAG: hypothetical protein ACI9BK_001950 [Acidimicrobiales bacterium]|jgi:hypothetical protein
MSKVGAPAPHDIFTDNHQWGDLDEWNRPPDCAVSSCGVMILAS